jgi:hypothetical protein
MAIGFIWKDSYANKLSEGFFLGLQNDYELMERKREIGGAVEGDQAAGCVASVAGQQEQMD